MKATRGQRSEGRGRGSRGLAMLEFAIIFPLLAVLVLGTVDVGRAFITWNQAKNAAREGAAYAQLYPNRPVPDSGECANPDNIRYRAQAESGNGFSIATSRVDVSPQQSLTSCVAASSPTAVPPGAEVEVTATKPFSLISPFVSAFVDIDSVSAEVTVVVQG